MRTRLVFDCPPSLNNCFTNRADGQGRVKSARYKAWRKLAAQQIATQPRYHHAGEVVVRYLFRRPCAQSDLGNLEKGVSDALVSGGIIVDDRFIVAIVLAWSGDIAGCEALIEDCSPEALQRVLGAVA